MVTGSGIFAGNLTNAGILSPGNSPGITTVQGDYLHESTASLIIEIGGSIAGDEYDQLAVEGGIPLQGGTLEILLWDDFVPQLGDSFTILNSDSLTGTFDTIKTLSLGEDHSWDFNELYSTGTISVIPEPSTFALLFGSLVLGMLVLRKRLL